jgi:hypothetical protein
MLVNKNINSRFVYMGISLIAAAVFIFLNKSLWFFDEDIFVANPDSPFLQQNWQRAYIVKQFFKTQHYFFEKNPAGYHIVSAMLHVINALLATKLFKMLCRQLQVLCAAADLQTSSYVFLVLFLITPVHSEPLCYILAQGVLVFAFFGLLSIIYFIKAIAESKKYLLPGLLFFLLSILCYEISWILPVVIFTLLVCINRANRSRLFKNMWVCLLYFLVLCSWLIIKSIFISKTLVADYSSFSFANMDFLQLFRNSAVLFIRSFLPPFTSTAVFIISGSILFLILSVCLYQITRHHKETAVFFICLFSLTVLSFLPTALFGIDSHDTESERYVYFSSVFSNIGVTALLFIIFKTKAVRNWVFAIFVLMFSWGLLTAVQSYKLAGDFSRQYSNLLQEKINGARKVFILNQPSQFKGALIMRALSRLSYLTDYNHTVINEHIRYLYNNFQTEIITVSIKEPVLPYQNFLRTISKPADSCLYYFPETASFFNQMHFDKEKDVIVALRNNNLYIFR